MTLKHPVWDVSLSTMWAISNFAELGDFFPIARQLGFPKVELNHQINSRLLAGVDINKHLISSIHEPCPADISVAELKARDWQVSSLDEDHRIQGVRSVKRSIDLARDIGVTAIIVHPGNVEMDMGLEDKLRTLFTQGQINSPQADGLRELIHSHRSKVLPAHMDAVLHSLRELADYSARAGVRLGLENRYHLYNIPFPDEMDWLLNTLDAEWVGFWYDVGHAHTLDRLGFFPHETWLQRFSDRMIGVHLHDVSGLEDHYAAGLGDVDWAWVARYLPRGVIRTVEVKPHNTPPQIQSGMELLLQSGVIQQIVI